MALKITCPSCGRIHPLGDPPPAPGSQRPCPCGQVLSVQYPQRIVEDLQRRRIAFAVAPARGEATSREEEPTAGLEPLPPPRRTPLGGGPVVREWRPEDWEDDRPTEVLSPKAPVPGDGGWSRVRDPAPASVPTPVPPSPSPRIFCPQPPPPPSVRTAAPVPPASPPPSSPVPPASSPPSSPVRLPIRPATPTVGAPRVEPPPAEPPRPPLPPPRKPPRRPPARRRRPLWQRLLRAAAVLALLLGILGVVAVGAGLSWFSRDLPTVEVLGRYRPPTVTVVNDAQGRLLGEIYEKRRYVVALEEIPKHVQDAFVASEDANFWSHGGVDPMGIVRAVLRNALQGRKAQGASTITQQVARNFLLTSEKKYSRKIKEMILAHRIERTFSKEHILFLYLNQIYLGSGAYGVEAAARTYFDKHVGELTLAEAAILAGLPQRPSDYSPHRNWEKARTRQEYVLDQLRDKGFIDRATWESTRAEVVTVTERRNEFLLQAPWFTEHVRRYLVETYGFDKVYNDGLVVDATCDLDLQVAAQRAVHDGVLRTSNSMGWRGTGERLEPAAIQPWLERQEQELREAEARQVLRVADPDSGLGGYLPVPDESSLQPGERYAAVVLEAHAQYLVAGVGRHRVMIPRSWTAWAYPPNTSLSHRSRNQDDLTRVFSRGDVVDVLVEATDVRAVKDLKEAIPASPPALAAGRIYQEPEVEGALLSYRLEDGAVVAMVGGYDFEKSEFNRAIQARRQVGSTIKPLVYTAAIQSRLITAGTLIQDAPLVYNTLNDQLWKPANFGGDYLGNITLRRALQLSKNVCTVRVLDRVGLEPVFQMAGPALRIGYDSPTCSRTHIPEDAECAGTRTPSPVEGMSWCEACDPTSCPVVRVQEQFQCLDEPWEQDGHQWCHSCDVNLRVCNWVREDRLPSGDRCTDARKDADGVTVCRACDLSMGLGSSSLTMLELARAYTAFATQGRLVEPHFVDRVIDRDGTVIEAWEAPEEWPQVLPEGVAGITHWLLREVATGGTAAASNRLGIQVAGKTGTTDGPVDAWFMGYSAELITGAWLGFDRPREMGVAFTGAYVALPMWMDYVAAAAPRESDKGFPQPRGVVFVPIDEATGRVMQGGRSIPMLPGTEPADDGAEVGQKTTQDLLTTDF